MGRIEQMKNRGNRNTIGNGLELGRLQVRLMRGALVACATAGGVACSAEPGAETLERTREAAQPSPVIDVRRSLAITDQPILTNFGLQRVLDQIIATSGVSGLTATALFQQWWDTQNPPPGIGPDPDAPHCSGTLNGYPYACRAEGGQATCDPFAVDSPCAYVPIGLFMRFDLAPEDGSHCGEYRVVFAKESGRFVGGNQNRNLLIFEAAMRNPHVNQGIRGCEKFVRAWAELSEEDDLEERRAQLEEWYFDGYQEFDPVIRFDAFGENPQLAGQIRTNQFIQPEEPRMWDLREYKLDKDCSTPECTLRFVPATNKANAYGPLFDGTSTHPNAPGFQAEFLTKVAALATADPNAIGMNTSDVYNSGQSLATSLSTEANYAAQFGAGYGSFGPAIQAELTTLGSSLTPLHIVKRAQVTACAGCHRFSNNADLGGFLWPPSLGFTHVSERDADLETVSGVTRFKISNALVNQLLPHRKVIVEGYLNEVPRPSKGPKVPIGGRWVH
jgi:hypothetical protein